MAAGWRVYKAVVRKGLNKNNKLNSPKMFFVQQNGFTNKTKIKTKTKFYVSVTRKDSSFYKKTSLL